MGPFWPLSQFGFVQCFRGLFAKGEKAQAQQKVMPFDLETLPSNPKYMATGYGMFRGTFLFYVTVFLSGRLKRQILRQTVGYTLA